MAGVGDGADGLLGLDDTALWRHHHIGRGVTRCRLLGVVDDVLDGASATALEVLDNVPLPLAAVGAVWTAVRLFGRVVLHVLHNF